MIDNTPVIVDLTLVDHYSQQPLAWRQFIEYFMRTHGHLAYNKLWLELEHTLTQQWQAKVTYDSHPHRTIASVEFSSQQEYTAWVLAYS